MNRYPARNPFTRLIEHAVNEALRAPDRASNDAPRLVPLENDPSPILVSVDDATGETVHPFELNSDVLNDPNSRLQVGAPVPPFPF